MRPRGFDATVARGKRQRRFVLLLPRRADFHLPPATSSVTDEAGINYHLHPIMLREVLQDLARGDLAVEFRETDFTT